MVYKAWKGTVTNYKNLHRNIRRLFATPDACEQCNATDSKRFEWANISGQYTIIRTDWAYLCVTCHRRLDADSYEGSRFTGRKHSAESKAKSSETMKQFWKDNREKMKAAHAKASANKRANNLKRKEA